MINLVLNTIIPEDHIYGMPAGSDINFKLYEKKYNIKKLCDDILKEINIIARSNYLEEFTELDENLRIKCLKILKSKKLRLFSSFLNHVFIAYYSNPKILSLIKNDLSGNFNNLDDFDNEKLTILDSVIKRGSIYKT